MFPLHDRTRRILCQAAFLAAGLLPIAATSMWCLGRYAGAEAQAEAESLSRQLGMEVSFTAMRHLRPGVVRYEGCRLADPESNRLVARCRSVEARWTTLTDPGGRSTPGITLLLVQLETDAGGLDHLGRVLQQVLQGRTGWRDPQVRFAAGDVLVRLGDTAQTVNDVQGLVATASGGVLAEVSFRLAGMNMPEPALLRIGRNRQTSPPSTGFEFSTGATPLPCQVLALGLSEFSRLGTRCQFAGSICANQALDGWQGQLSGELKDIDVGGLLVEPTHKFSGSASVSNLSARFRGGRVEEASGTLSAGPGVLSRSLLTAAIERLGLSATQDFLAQSELVSYEQLGVDVAINGDGLKLTGRCPASEPGVILVDRYKRTLMQPERQPQSLGNLVQMLAPTGQPQVAANRQNERLLRVLPIPEFVGPEKHAWPPQRTPLHADRNASPQR